ncbi:MAG: histidine kinase dimerization/phospho-acceptor domain-containing protein, partial [Fibrobacterota bacterium]
MAAVVLFLVAAGKNVVSGSAVDPLLSSYNHTLIFWASLAALYVAVGALILGVTRVLFGAFRRVLLRTQEGETRSKLDKERLAEILKGVNDAIFLHDAENGQILEVFGRYSDMYGCSSEEILSGGVGQLSAQIESWTDESAIGWMQKCLKEGSQTFTWRSKRADGGLFWTEVSMRSIHLDRVERILVTVRDIDTLMKSHLELASLNADLERRVLLRTADIQRERDASDAFSYTVSHDLRAPLRAIDGYARILTEDFSQQLPDEARKYLGRMVAGAERMSQLIDALLSLSRLERQSIVLETVDVAKLLEDVHQELRDGGNCRIHSQGFCDMAWSIGPLPEIRSDPQLAKQVFANLVGNACKFTRESPEPRISIRSFERPDGIWFEIADNGSGFDMAYADKLFKVFQRLHPDSIEGIGIGLATVK